jgi:hypothetical protein
MQATWSQPVAEAVVFSNDFARRRERPRVPWATSTRQASRIGRNTGCLSSHPTRRISRSWCLPSVRAAAAVTPRSRRNCDHTRVQGERLGQVAPLAAGVGDAQHRVHHLPEVRFVLGSALAGRVEHRFQQRPLFVGQVTGVRHVEHGADQAGDGSHHQIEHTQLDHSEDPVTTPTTPQPEPGWYPDPSNPSRPRYWDGSTWTTQLAQQQDPQSATAYPVQHYSQPAQNTMSLPEAVRTCLTKYVEFSGRARRSEYWWFALSVLIVYVFASLLGRAVGAGAILVLGDSVGDHG